MAEYFTNCSTRRRWQTPFIATVTCLKIFPQTLITSQVWEKLINGTLNEVWWQYSILFAKLFKLGGCFYIRNVPCSDNDDNAILKAITNAHKTDAWWAKNFPSGVHGAEDVVLTGLLQDKTTTWLKLRDRDGRGWRKTDLFGVWWILGRPISNSGCLSIKFN